MNAYRLIVFFLSLNASGLIISGLVAGGVLMPMDSAMPYSTSEINNLFSLTAFMNLQNLTYGALGAGIGAIVGWITKQGTYAIYIILLWLLGSMLGITTFLLNGIPKMIAVLTYGTGLDALHLDLIFEGFFLAFFFFWLAGLLSQGAVRTE